MRKERAGALIVLPDLMFFDHLRRLVDLAARNRMPSMHGYRAFADAGALMSYGTSDSDLFRRAAVYVDKILKGARPADLPVEQPAKFELVVNLKAARALGLTIPQSLLIRADRIIE
jgi:putative ABC transport system substrate-binding protein